MSEAALDYPVAVKPRDMFIKSTFRVTVPFTEVQDENRVVVGYASVEMLDKQNEVITLEALKDAFPRFMKSGFNITGVMHSNFPAGRVLEKWEDAGGEMWKSGIDEQGLFIVSKVRDDVKRANEVWDLIKQDRLKAYSIGGQAIIKVPVCDERKCFWRIDKLDIHEISYVDNPANPASRLAVLKAESLLKSEDFDLAKLAPLLEGLTHAVLIKDYVRLAGSQGDASEGHGYDVIVRDDAESPLKGHVETAFKEMLPDLKMGSGEMLDMVWDDSQTSKADRVPLFDLVLLRRNPELVKTDADAEGLITANALETLEQKMPNDDDKKKDKNDEKKPDEETKAATDDEKEEDDATKTDATKSVEVSPILLEMKAQLDKLAQDLDELRATKAADEEEEEEPKDEEKKADVQESGDLEIPEGAQEQEQPVEEAADAPGVEQTSMEPKKVAKAEDVEDDDEDEEKKFMTKGDADAYIKGQVEEQLKLAVEKLTKVEKRSPGDLGAGGDIDVSTKALASMSWEDVHKMAAGLGDRRRF